jgi:thiol-disulfide isomerase/thioredoxin
MAKLILSACIILSALQADAQKQITEAQLKALSFKPGDTLYVVNFWAIWCKPCIEEMPYFIQLAEKLKNQPVQFFLVSLDFKSQEEKLREFVLKKGIPLPVYQLIPENSNQFINQIDPDWSGAIPATAYYRNAQKVYFYEGEYTFENLSLTLNKLINP